MTPADVLRQAADLIEPDGAWAKGAPAYDEDGNDLQQPEDVCGDRAVKWCTLGAITRCEQGGPDHIGTYACEALLHRLGTPVGTCWWPWAVADWNDSPHRTQAEVVATLRAAADTWEAGDVG